VNPSTFEYSIVPSMTSVTYALKHLYEGTGISRMAC
jgi:hypothetical protein